MNDTFITNTTESSNFGGTMSPGRNNKYKNIKSNYAQSNRLNKKKARAVDDEDENYDALPEKVKEKKASTLNIEE